MPEDKSIRPENVETRSASTNAGLGIAAFLAARPYIDKAISKVTRPKDEAPKIERPPGYSNKS